jgi:alanine racemase
MLLQTPYDIFSRKEQSTGIFSMAVDKASFSQGIPHRSWVQIDEDALRWNTQWAANHIAPAGLLPVIKANAYQHDAVRVARVLSPHSAAFAVANLCEAENLRNAGITHDLLLLAPCLPAERLPVIESGFIAAVSSFDEALQYARIANVQRPARLLFKIDTGMGRIGAWKEEGLAALSQLRKVPEVQIDMISTHLSAADEDEDFTLAQLRWFREQEGQLRSWFPKARLHALNSAGILRHPEFSMDLVRAGLLLYGVSPVPEGRQILRPVMSWKTRIVLLRDVPAGRRVSYGGEFVTSRDSVLAVLPVGYADGYFRQIASGTARVIIRGHRYPVVGRVTMDQIIVDVTDLPGAASLQPGDEVTLLGADEGERITAEEMANWAGTIPWHIFTAIGNRVERF